MKNGFVNKNKFLEDFGRFVFFYFPFLFIIRVLFVMEVSVDVVRVRERMVMIIFAKREVVGIHTCIIDTFNFIY